jgi:hypothetical protein
MILSLEALRAQHGDCLLLHFGEPGKPRTVLIDGGPTIVYEETLKQRLLELRRRLIALGQIEADAPLPLAMALVSHIDDDHIGGLLALAEDDDGGLGLSSSSWIAPMTLWHNTFDEIAQTDSPIGDLTLGSRAQSKTAAILASVTQGNKLRSCAERLGWPINKPFKGCLVQARPQGGQPVKLDESTSLLVLGPRSNEIERMRREWQEQLRKLRQKKTDSAKVAEYLDSSPTNLSSIVCLVRQGERKILLTGDARGDLILEGLDAAGVTSDGSLHVDILKLPHHGSNRDVDTDFFERITADHYVISANGRDGNPDSETLQMIATSRGNANDFTIHLTYGVGRGDLERRLADFISARDVEGRTYGVDVRPDPDPFMSVDLGDPPFAGQPTP